MLEPNERHHLLELLRPPPGYTLDRAVGTTFSLDLPTLLTVPLAFTFFDREDEEGQPGADPIVLLEAIRRSAERLSLFCQGGRIAIPGRQERLLCYLEESVFEVAAPGKQGVFHPKVWLLRYTSPDLPVFYRFLCLSRNLTFDRAWDTVLCLEGALTDRKNAFGANNPLGDFIAALPGLALRALPERVEADVALLQHEVRRVAFRLPDGFTEVRFWPLGLTRHRYWPFDVRKDRMLVVSPFVSDRCLERLVRKSREPLLVSRLESLDALRDASVQRFGGVYHLDPAARVEEEDWDEASGIDNEEEALQGLHLKLYVADAGWDARVWTGSANATDAAFNHNVEFLVELAGRKSRVGIDALLGQDKEQGGLADMLRPYQRPDETAENDRVQRRLERMLGDAAKALASARLEAHIIEEQTPDTFTISLIAGSGERLALPEPLAVTCRPITLSAAMAVSLRTKGAPLASFGHVSFEGLTPFFAFLLTASDQGRVAASRFVLNCVLHGAPEERKERVLRSLLKDRSDVVRLLLLLLTGEPGEIGGALELATREPHGGSGGHSAGFAWPLFETLVRALKLDPDRLARVARLVEELQATEEGAALLPEDFDAIWDPIRTVYERLHA